MKKRFSEEQIIGFLKEAEAGVPVKELCRKHGFSDASFYTWRSKFGGMDVSDAMRLKAMEQENARLKKLLAEARRCEEDVQLKAQIVELAQQRRRFGYRRIHALLRRDGVEANHKRIYRLYKEANLAVRRRKRRKGLAVPREPLSLPSRRNEVWSMDFVMDALANGRRLKVLTIVDDCTKEAIDLVVDFGISGQYVTRILDQAAQFRGYPAAIRTDQGPEFTGKALDQWAYEHGVRLKLIQPGKPTHNAYIESFNGRFRDECLNDQWFHSLAHARAVIQAWRQDYNELRPHSMLGYQTPAEVAEHLRQQ